MSEPILAGVSERVWMYLWRASVKVRMLSLDGDHILGGLLNFDGLLWG